jgi:hypothetical protein
MGKLIEVDEDVYNRSVALQQTLAKIASDPKRKAQLERLHKEVDPTVATPTLDAEAKVAEPIEAVRKEFAEFKKAQEEKAAKDEAERQETAFKTKWSAGQEKLRSRGFTPEGIKAIEELMAKEGITNHEIAANHWEREHPPQPPTMPGATGAWNFLEMPTDGDADLKRLVETKGENVSLLDKMTHEALAEVRGTRR